MHPEVLLQNLLGTLPDDLAEFRRFASETDWRTLFQTADTHSAAALIYHYLGAAGIRLPAGLESDVQDRLKREWLALLRLQAAFHEAAAVLASAGIRAVALKGPWIGERLYPEPFLRPSSDIDLMVDSTDLERAQAALESIGYRADTGPVERYYRENQHHIHLRRPGTPPLELHFRPCAAFGVNLPSGDLVSRAVRFPASDGREIWTLAPEDEALYLALHAASHLFSSLIWLFDLKLLLRRYPDLDWSIVFARARASGAVTMLALALELLHRRLGVSIEPARKFFPSSRLRLRVASQALEAAAAHPGIAANVYGAALCDLPAKSLWRFRHRFLRFLRRRTQSRFPLLTPRSWSA